MSDSLLLTPPDLGNLLSLLSILALGVAALFLQAFYQRRVYVRNERLQEDRRHQHLNTLLSTKFGTSLEDLRIHQPPLCPSGSLYPLLQPTDWLALQPHIDELIEAGIQPTDLDLVLRHHTWSLIGARSSLVEASLAN